MENSTAVNNILGLILNEVQKHNMARNIDISKYKEKIASLIQTTKTKLDQNSLDKIDTYLKNNNVISKIVNACVINIQNILKDGKIDLNDTSYFLDIVREIYEQVNNINQENVSIKISSDDLIELCGLLMKIILVYTINDQTSVDLALKISNSAIGLLKFSMKKTSWSFKCCC